MSFATTLPGWILPLLISATPVLAQNRGSATIPRDASYTLESAYQKYRKKQPFIVPRRYDDTSEICRQSGIVYSTIGSRELVLDLFTPDKAGSQLRPVVLLIHGGGWRSGDRSLMYPLANYIASHEYVALAVEYRLSPEARYPAAVDDIRQAITWIREHSATYSADASRIALLGCSSGAQLVGLVGLTEGTDKNPDVPTIQAIVNIDGIMDFNSEEARKFEDNPDKPVTAASAWLGGHYDEQQSIWKEASPVYYVTRDAPPILFINSALPRFHVGRDEVIAELNRHGITSEVHTFDDAPHSFWLFDPWFEPTAQHVVHFFDKVLQPTSEN